MARTLKTAPAEEPLSLSEVKAYLKVTSSDDDVLITRILAGVRRACEAWTGRALVTQTWTLWLDGFPRTNWKNTPSSGHFDLPVDSFDAASPVINLPLPPLQSVSFLKTYDADNQPATFDSTKYFVDTASQPGRLVLNQGASWPSGLRPANAVEIEFVAGYGAAAAVPESIKQGILVWAQLLYANQKWLFESGEEVTGLSAMNRDHMPAQVEALWQPFRLFGLKGIR
ncbi:MULTISPECIES: head-tail connector protein [unclassified Nitrospina]|uniref:head-tail connector protein n=1 Tax=unclassified Nitrospina TaxID=2638683 RepID=UPI003F97B6AF